MLGHWIKNFDELATTEQRKKILEIIEAGFDAIDTKKIITSSISLSDNNILRIKDTEFDLKNFEKIKLVGFGKAVSSAAKSICSILGDHIETGVIIDLQQISDCGPNVKSFKGDHPRPTIENVKASQEIVNLANGVTEKDLIIIVVSGGGSSLFCWPESEYIQGKKLYDEFIKHGGTIVELNTIRKHISGVKGGQLAKLFYPATIAGLIFCDVPGNYFQEVASGPTFKDPSTIEDAQKIADKYDMKGFEFSETPKEDTLFEKVFNIPMVSNEEAIKAMSTKATELGLSGKVSSLKIYENAEIALQLLEKDTSINGLALAGGEIRMEIKNNKGSGGRNQFLAMSALKKIKPNQIFASIASDGLDNGNAAGAIVDFSTVEKIKELGLNLDEYIQNYDSYSLLQKTGNLIFTGQTEANVSDLMIFANF